MQHTKDFFAKRLEPSVQIKIDQIVYGDTVKFDWLPSIKARDELLQAIRQQVNNIDWSWEPSNRTLIVKPLR